MLKAVFFDLNGVLIISEYLSDRFEVAYDVPSEDFIPALKNVMDVVRKPSAPNMFSLWVPYFKKWQINLNEGDFLNFWFMGESVNKEALTYVESLRSKGIKVFVVSNNFRERTLFYRSQFSEIFDNLDDAYFSWETGNVKPDREAIEYVLNEQNIKPEEVVYFDDSQKNIEVAKNIGVDGQLWVDLDTAKKYIELRVK